MLKFLRIIGSILSRLVHFPYIDTFIKEHPIFLLELFYKGDFWALRESCIAKPSRRKELLYLHYLRTHGASIGLRTKFDGIPVLPHSLSGIFISTKAHIGKNVVIFQQVTIGSIATAGSKNQGAPTIGDNVYIGAGAKIIGNCKIGNNCRIGANCIVTKDVPNNCVCVNRGLEIIQKDEELDNTFVPAYQQKIYYKNK
jgi:serine acetyltransferase